MNLNELFLVFCSTAGPYPKIICGGIFDQQINAVSCGAMMLHKEGGQILIITIQKNIACIGGKIVVKMRGTRDGETNQWKIEEQQYDVDGNPILPMR